MTRIRFKGEHPINFGARLVKPDDELEVDPAVADRLASSGQWEKVTEPISETMEDAFDEAPPPGPWSDDAEDPEGP